MGDVGDYWNAARSFKRDARSTWNECPSQGCQFGGNPVKVAPGSKCRHCGWQSPGNRGSDVEHARAREAHRSYREAEEAERKSARQATHTCQICRKAFGSVQARTSHERDKHTAALAKAVTS